MTSSNGNGVTEEKPFAVVPHSEYHDDEDVPNRERPFHTHPFLTEAGRKGHAHKGGDQPHTHDVVAGYDAKRYTDIADYLVFVRRVLKGMAGRVAEADLEALAQMVQLRDELEGSILEAIKGLRWDDQMPASWQDIGEACGTTRQAAQRRYGAVGGARRAGGQRSDWR